MMRGRTAPMRFTEQSDGVRFAVKVIPGASRDQIVGELGDALKVVVSKPPHGGAANNAVLALLADALRVPRSAVRIRRGHHTPRKDVFAAGLTAAQAAERLLDQSRS